MVRRLHWDGKVPGICWGPRLLQPWPGACHRIWGGVLDHQLPLLKNREGSLVAGGTWMLEVAGGNREEVGDTQKQYTSAGTVDAGTRETEVPGDTWRREELGRVRP